MKRKWIIGILAFAIAFVAYAATYHSVRAKRRLGVPMTVDVPATSGSFVCSTGFRWTVFFDTEKWTDHFLFIIFRPALLLDEWLTGTDVYFYKGSENREI